jgi:hypothetical protein
MSTTVQRLTTIVGGKDPVGTLRLATMVCVDGMTTTQAAEQAGLNQSNVVRRLARLRSRVAALGINPPHLIEMLREMNL